MNIEQIKPNEKITAEYLNKLAQQINKRQKSIYTGYGAYDRRKKGRHEKAQLGVVWQILNEEQKTFLGVLYSDLGFAVLSEHADYSSIAKKIYCPMANWDEVLLNNHFIAIEKQINKKDKGWLAMAVFQEVWYM